MFRSKKHAQVAIRALEDVSILVLVDVSLEEFCRTPSLCTSISFNPCSRGCFARRIHVIPSLCTSISFNPCSRGCFARSMNVHDAWNQYVLFQSLFSWMFRSKPELYLIKTETGFQSLFSWMFRSKFPMLLRVQFHPAVSILVLVDVSLEAPTLMYLSDIKQGFNPCSRGCFARSGIIRSGYRGIEPVSILVLVDVSLEGVTVTVSLQIDWFQSLFSWMFRSKNHRVTDAAQFQSLFSWMFRSKSVAKSDLIVSILVLVDVSLEVERPAHVFHGLLFQSLFSWMFRSKIQVPCSITRMSSFNPCSRGCFARSVKHR